eukprot:Nk52_evm2s1869 gene=Nk52_evmTU2s1869
MEPPRRKSSVSASAKERKSLGYYSEDSYDDRSINRKRSIEIHSDSVEDLLRDIQGGDDNNEGAGEGNIAMDVLREGGAREEKGQEGRGKEEEEEDVPLTFYIEERLKEDKNMLHSWQVTGCEDVKMALNQLNMLCDDNIWFFQNLHNDTSAKSSRSAKKNSETFELTYQKLKGTLFAVEEEAFVVSKMAQVYDIDAYHRGNGYRSLIQVLHACLERLISVSEQCKKNRHSQFFYSDANLCELSEYTVLVQSLCGLLNLAVRLAKECSSNSIFCFKDHDFTPEMKMMNKEIFYGSRFGFQYPDSMRRLLRMVCVLSASYSFGHRKAEKEGGHSLRSVSSTLLQGVKYAFNSEKRAKQLCDEFENGDVSFAKGFWDLAETTMARQLPKLLETPVAVNMKLKLLTEAILIPERSTYVNGKMGGEGRLVLVEPPLRKHTEGLIDEENATSGISSQKYEFNSVNGRLISHHLRHGQDQFDTEEEHRHWECLSTGNNLLSAQTRPRTRSGKRVVAASPQKRPSTDKPMDPCPNLLLHFHGGGFIAQSSEAHQSYLKSWAKDLGCTVLSIDYSLAPEFPFPRQVEECFYAYAWALTHCEEIGSSGEKICLVGDSAGGNLAFAVTLKAIDMGIRIPDSILGIYPSLVVRDAPAPSRILSAMDPLLSLGILQNVLAAYSGNNPEHKNNYYMSPLLAPDECLKLLPPTYIVSAELDPLLDDSLDFARRLRRLGREVHFRTVRNVPHGFLSFTEGGESAKNAVRLCVAYLHRMFDT